VFIGIRGFPLSAAEKKTLVFNRIS